jgi:hypothetical protein
MKCPRCQQANHPQTKFCLARAGFAIEHVSSGSDRAPYGSNYPGEFIFVVRRRGESADIAPLRCRSQS